jgi:hypothetical protein
MQINQAGISIFIKNSLLFEVLVLGIEVIAALDATVFFHSVMVHVVAKGHRP